MGVSGCPPAWVNNDKAGVCYSHPKDTLSWEKARTKCQESGGDLALPTTKEELTFIRDNAKRYVAPLDLHK